jgi:hypothetical protein
MTDFQLHELLGRAKGALEFQPIGPPRKAETMVVYRRYAERGVEGFASWDVPPAQLRRFVSSALRAVTLERLAEATGRLEAALAAQDRETAMRVGEAVQECLDVLREHRAVRPGRRSVARSEGVQDRSDRRPRAEVAA